MSLTGGTLTGGYPARLHYDALVAVRCCGYPYEFEPSIASMWEFNDDYTSISLQLRDDVVFADGSKLDAAVVARNFEERYIPTAPYWGGTGVEATGEYSVTIALNGQIPPATVLIGLASDASIVSASGLDDPDSLAESPSGSGPYLLDEERTIVDQEFVFVPNPDYWDADQFVWDEFVVKVFADGVGMLNALKSGQIDVGAQLNHNFAAEAEASGVEVEEIDQAFTGIYILDRDGEVVPALGDVRVRQAMNMAFDRAAIVDAVQNGYGTPTNQPWSAGSLMYRADSESVYSYDPELARQLLAEAGYPDGFDLPIPSFGSPYEPIIQQALGDIGIRVTYTAYQADQFATLGHEGAWPVFINAGPYGPITYDATGDHYIPSIGYWNVLAEPNQYVDDLMRTVNFGGDDARADAAAELGEFVLDEAWFVPLTTSPSLWAHEPGVEAPGDPSRHILAIRPAE